MYLRFVFILCLISCSVMAKNPYGFEQKLKLYNNYKNGPGIAVGVYRGDKTIFENGFGTRNRKDKITVKTNFRLASVSKQFTAYAIAILEDRKKINQNDSILKYFPEFPKEYSKTKIKHLLNHSSGLKDYMSLCGTRDTFNSDVISYLSKQSLSFESGTKYEYSNSGYVVLASLVERVSKVSFPQFVTKELFKPLEMNNSLVFEKKVQVSNRAIGVGAFPYFDTTDFSHCNFVYGDGGIYSSVSDLRKWQKAFKEKRLVSEKQLVKMLKNSKLDNGKSIAYSYGLIPEDSFKNKKMVFHNGGWVGFRTQVSYFPENDTLFILLSNYRGISIWKTFTMIADEIL